MHKLRSGGGGGGGSARRGGVRPAESAPAVWQSLIGAHIALIQLVVDELSEQAAARAEHHADDEDAGEDEDEDEEDLDGVVAMLSEQIDALDSVKKRKLPFADRMGLIGMIDELYGEHLSTVASIDSEDAAVVEVTEGAKERGEELQVEDLYTTALAATLAYCADCISRAGGPAKAANKLQQDAEQESLFPMKLIDTIVQTSFSQSKYAKSAVKNTMDAIVKLLIGVGSNENRATMTRDAALSVLSDVIEQCSDLFADNQPLLESLLDTCFTLCGDLKAIDLDSPEGANQNYGTSVLDVLANSVTPTETIAKAILDRANKGSESSAEKDNKGALVCLAVLPSAAQTFVNEHSDVIWALIERGLTNQSNMVRASALVAGGELVENSSVAHHKFAAALNTAAWKSLDDSNEAIYIKLRACAAITQIIGAEHETKSSAINTDDLVNKVLALIQSVSPHTATGDSVSESWQLTESLVSIVQAGIEADEAKSISFAPVMEAIMPVWTGTDSTVKASHATLALIAAIVGAFAEDDKDAKAIVTSHGAALLTALESNLSVSDSAVRASAHRALAALAPALGELLKSTLSMLVPTITRVFSEEYTPGGAPSQVPAGHGHHGHDHDEDGEEEDDDEETDAMDEDAMEAAENEANAVNDERMAALTLYRSLLDTLGPAMLEYNDSVWSTIVSHSQDWDAPVQDVVAEIVPHLSKLFPSQSADSKWSAGVSGSLPGGGESVIQSAVKLMVGFVRYGVDPTPVAQALDAINALLAEYGQVVVMSPPTVLESLVSNAKKILKGDAICQQGFQGSIPAELREQIEAATEANAADEQDEDGDEVDRLREALGDDEGEDDEEEGGNGDEAVVRSLLDCLATLAKVRGSAFSQTFVTLFPLLVKSGSNSQSGYAFGVTPELTAQLALPSNPVWADELIEAIVTFLTEAVEKKNMEASRNGVYALGALVFAGQEALGKHRSTVITLSKHLIDQCNTELEAGIENADQKADVLGARDNAASALSKAALSFTAADNDTLTDLLPTLLSALPITEDEQEQSVPLSLLVKLINQDSAVVQANREAIAAIFEKVIAAPVVDASAEREATEGTLAVPRAVHDYVSKALEKIKA